MNYYAETMHDDTGVVLHLPQRPEQASLGIRVKGLNIMNMNKLNTGLQPASNSLPDTPHPSAHSVWGVGSMVWGMGQLRTSA